MLESLRKHWPEYLMEGALLGAFMVSAGGFATLLEYSGSPVHQAIPDAFVRRVLMGIAMGLTAILLIYSPWGRQSGAHMNPAITLTFLRLGKIKRWDAVFYITAQLAGGTAGVILIHQLLNQMFSDPPVSYVATVPGPFGLGVAFAAEFTMCFLMMGMVLAVTNTKNLAQYTGVFAGFLLANFITWEVPLSGTSINPARTFASALPGGIWTAYWLYVLAPLGGMLAAAQLYVFIRGLRSVQCCKFVHSQTRRCIHCGFEGVKA